LVESNANGNIIIKATTEGRIESLATKGQMVDKGSSLAQIKPTGDIEYYLILWLPNNSIPYVKPGDVINIRYDAFHQINLGNSRENTFNIFGPASRQEMSEYTNVNNGTNQQELALYKTIVKIENKTFNIMVKRFRFQMDSRLKPLYFLKSAHFICGCLPLCIR
jgi:membrane fusion protein